MAAKYLINDGIVEQLEVAMAHANVLHENQTIPSNPTAYRQQTYALTEALRRAIHKIRRYDE